MNVIHENLKKLEDLLHSDMNMEFMDQVVESEITDASKSIRDCIMVSNIDRIYFEEKLECATSSLRTALGLKVDPGASRDVASRQFIHFINLLRCKL